MTYTDDLNAVLKYVTDRKEDFYSSLMGGSGDLTPHHLLVDFLQERDESDPLVHRLRTELDRTKSGQKIRPVRLGDAYSLHDFVLHALRTGHPNPAVRAFAGLSDVGHPPHPDLLNLLFHSDRPEDQDAAVWLHPEDETSSHSSHSLMKKLNSRQLKDNGLETKAVRGTAYLLDHEATDHNYYGAPEIRFTAPINDHSELAEMEQHAHQLAEGRAEMGPATVGPAHFGS